MSEIASQYALAVDPVNLAQAVFADSEFVRRRRRWLLRVIVGASLFVIAGLFFASLAFDWHFDQVWRYEAVGLIGATVGTAELLSRYRDAPSFVLLSPPGIGYIAINAAASLLAMGVIRAFDWRFGATGDAVAATQVLTAGFGAMALFRSSLLTVKAGNDDVGIGPSSVLSIMMAASDRSADRLRAADRAGRVHDIMGDVSYDLAQQALPTVAVALMQNLSPADAAGLESELAKLKNEELPDNTKALLLGLKITNVVSTAVLGAAKDCLGDSILRPPEATSTVAATGNGNTAEPDDRTSGLVEDVLAQGGSGYASGQLPQTPQTPNPPNESPPTE